MSAEPLLVVRDLETHFPIRRGLLRRQVGAVRAVDGVSFAVGRGRTLASPAALDGKSPLSNSAGPILDPVVCIRQTVLLQPNEA